MDEKQLLFLSEEKLKSAVFRLLHQYGKTEHFSSPVLLTLFTAILRAGGQHADLLRASLGETDSFSHSVIHTIFADSLELILDEIAGFVGDQKLEGKALLKIAEPVLKKHLQSGQKLDLCERFSLLKTLKTRKTVAVFEGILSQEDLEKLYEIKIEELVKAMEAHVNEESSPEIKKLQSQLIDLGWEAKGKVYCELIFPKMEEIR